MESTTENFLSRKEIIDKVKRGEKLNPIDQFLFRYGSIYVKTDDRFRKVLFELITHIQDEKK